MSDGNGDGNFAEYIARERERLHAEREQIFTQQEELQRQLEAVNREFAAIEAYEGAKTGKAARQQAPAGRQSRARRGSRREGLLELIQQGNGLSRGEILERMGLKGDKQGQMSVSKVRREGGKYYPGSQGQGEAELSLAVTDGDLLPEAESGTFQG
jgi:hypothetical protein